MRSTLLLTAASLAATFACSNDIAGVESNPTRVAQDEASANRSRSVPFRAHYVASILGVGPGPGCDARLSFVGEGRGTHLGHFTATLSFCGRADNTLDTGAGTFVAANGDLLNFTFHGVGDGVHPVLHFISYVTFTGGTGRFEGVAGKATVIGSFDDNTGSGPADWFGTLTFAR